MSWVLSSTSPAAGFRLNVTEEGSGALERQFSPPIGVRFVSFNVLLVKCVISTY